MDQRPEDEHPAPQETESGAESDKKLFEFFEEIGASTACPRCGTKLWWGMNASDDATNIELVGTHVLRVQTLACTRCGLIERHVSDIVSGNVKRSI